MGELAAVLKRISTDLTKQEIKNQDDDIRRHVREHRYRVTRTFELEASAYHGEHAPALAEILADVRAGRYRVVVMAMTSRVERRGWKPLMRFLLELDALGGRVEAVDDPNFGKLDDDNPMAAAMTMMKGHGNWAYSDEISKNVNRANRRYDGLGYWRGKAPAGYEIYGPEKAKRLREAERPYVIAGKMRRRVPSASEVRQAFEDAAGDTSTTELGRRLEMTPTGIVKMLRLKFYSTGVHRVKRHDGTTYAYRIDGEPLVTVRLQKAAIKGLKRRRCGDNVTSRGMSEPDFSGCVKCEQGHPLYRYYGNVGKGAKTRRYQCKVCKVTVKADPCDALVDKTIRQLEKPVFARVHHGGDADRQDRVDRLRTELDNPPAGMSRSERREWEDGLWDEIEALEAMPGTEPWFEDVATGDTIASLWKAADHAGKVKLLKTRIDIRVRATADRSGRAELAGEVLTSRIEVRHE